MNNRQIDAMVEQKIFNREIVWVKGLRDEKEPYIVDSWGNTPGHHVIGCYKVKAESLDGSALEFWGALVPSRTGDIGAAWQVKKKIIESGEWRFNLHNEENGWSEAAFKHGTKGYFRAEANTDEMAICLAALKAVGVEINDLEK